MVAVGHFCVGDGDGAPRWMASFAEARAAHKGLRADKAVERQWGATMQVLRERGVTTCAPERGGGAADGWRDEGESKEDARRGADLLRRRKAQQELVAETTRAKATAADEAAAGLGAEAWAAKLREATGYEGAPASQVVGERVTGLADGAEIARGPRIFFQMQRHIDDLGGDEGWMQRDEVGEDGWRRDWLQRAERACEGLDVDWAGYVVWSASGVRLTAEEAAARGPAVEMATRARLALGEEVEVVDEPPAKRSGGRQRRPGRRESHAGGGSGLVDGEGHATSVEGGCVCPLCGRGGGSACTWIRCGCCERLVHTRCMSPDQQEWCRECAGAWGEEELFAWQNEAARLESEAAGTVEGVGGTRAHLFTFGLSASFPGARVSNVDDDVDI